MFTSTEIILAVMIVTYIGARMLKISTELSMFAAALAGAIAGGSGIPIRHIVEGAFTYFDIILIFITATLFMNLLKHSGGISFVVRRILSRFHRKKVMLLVLMTFLLLIPGALTGAGSVTVLIMAGLISTVLNTMGLSRPRITAIIFILAGLSAAAPPVSLWAMLTAAGINMPYVGFFLPLLIPCVVLGLLTVFILGWKSKPVDLEKALIELPEPPVKMNWFRVTIPFLAFFLLVLAGRIGPHSLPIIGLPMMFMVSAGLAFSISPRKLDILKISRDTVHQLLPLIGTLTCVGVLVQIMTLTGVRGLIAITTVTLPLVAVILTLPLVLPASEAVLMWGAAPVLGVPLVLLFNTIGFNPIVALAGMSIIWPLGDALPPTAIIGRLAKETVGMKEPYSNMLKYCVIPALIIIAVGILMVIYSKKLSFLTML
ncbi:MAG: C4-dicarboxylate ABC transporter [Candidatus Aminicenantes bacterium]|nr:C4-dicarboxylate ABC transporter [Candidatus Aminicenantes bacterium]